jgi:predicted transcriptional regulator
MNYRDCMTMQKFSSQARPELLEEVRRLAAAEGRQFQAVLDEALSDWVDRKKGETPRPEVIAHAKASIARHRPLYEELAK